MIGQAKSIAHTTIRSMGEQIECFAVARDLLGVQHFIELLLDIFYTDRFEMELQTSRQDGQRQLCGSVVASKTSHTQAALQAFSVAH